MCLIVFAWDLHPKYKLILAANRDEFYNRPTAPAGFWEENPDILAGRDLQAGGTWMSISRQGKFAAVTNYRDLKNIKEDATSRGEIPVNFLEKDHTPDSYLEELHHTAENYNGFNVLVGTIDKLMHYSNYERKLNVIDRGIHGLSNALLDTNWPKVEIAKSKFDSIISKDFSHQELISMMGNTDVAEEEVLPDTGISKDLEKALSAMCIRTESYGTVSTSVLTLDRFGLVELTEKTYPVGGREEQTNEFQYTIE